MKDGFIIPNSLKMAVRNFKFNFLYAHPIANSSAYLLLIYGRRPPIFDEVFYELKEKKESKFILQLNCNRLNLQAWFSRKHQLDSGALH